MGDLGSWAELDADAAATRFIGGVQSRARARTGLTEVTRMLAHRGASLFSVYERESGRWVGRVGPWLPADAIGPEVGWALLPATHGKGYATEAARAAMGWAFETLGWTEVIHCIHQENAASIAVAGRLGSRWLRSHQGADGDAVEIYGQTRSDWASNEVR